MSSQHRRRIPWFVVAATLLATGLAGVTGTRG